MNRIFIPVVIGVIVVAIYALNRWDYWVSESVTQSTENAYFETDVTMLSSKVSGHIVMLPVKDYQYVQKGDLIAVIDDKEYRLELLKREADYQKAVATLDNLASEIAQQEAKVAEAKANIEMATIRVKQQQKHFDRQEKLVSKGALSHEQFDNTEAGLDLARKSFDITQAQLTLEERALELLQGQRRIRQAEKDAAFSTMEIAKEQLSNTKIKAPFSGTLGKINAKVGEIVMTNTLIASIIPQDILYIMANFKETQLANIRSGQMVEILVDSFPREKFAGIVEEIAPISGARSSNLPIVNTSGNFTKIVQRIPVKIMLNSDGPQYAKLRAGMSLRVNVDTSSN
ncbi:HlyD family secretion protein [Wohlfahrtiimonas larvae]|uniref:HlyD family secretion protein n=1 Tax=Wohlfahrtiimonas larvae TaxID=1157986 RepID=A0ABP9MWE7_9GAMM|nr:HlyD family secretion protein [Wohlfahrtiimonas larvae]